MKKILAMLLALVMVLSLAACSVEKAPETTAAPETEAPAVNENPVETEAGPAPVEISLWTYPIGKWVDEATVAGLIADFNAVYPHITVSRSSTWTTPTVTTRSTPPSKATRLPTSSWKVPSV